MTYKSFGGMTKTSHTWVCNGENSNMKKRSFKEEQAHRGQERAPDRDFGARAAEYLEGEHCSAVIELKKTYVRSLMEGKYRRSGFLTHVYGCSSSDKCQPLPTIPKPDGFLASQVC